MQVSLSSISKHSCEGRPKIVTTPETNENVNHIVFNNRRVKMSEIAKTVEISEGRVRNILHKELGMQSSKQGMCRIY